MGKPEPGMPATVVLADGLERPLRFPLRILKDLKASHDIDILKGGALNNGLLEDLDRLAILLAAGLRAGDPDITTAWVQDNVDAAMLRSVVPNLIYAATGQWLGDAMEAAAQAQIDQVIAGNGTASGNGAASDGTNLSAGWTSGPSDATTSDSPNPNSGN